VSYLLSVKVAYHGLRIFLKKIYISSQLVVFGSDIGYCKAVFYKVHASICRFFFYKESSYSRFKSVGLQALPLWGDFEAIQKVNNWLDSRLKKSSEGYFFLPVNQNDLVVPQYLMSYFLSHYNEISKILGSHFQIHRVNIYRTYPKPKDKGDDDSSFAWHYDSAPFSMNKIFIYLDDTRRANGAFGWLNWQVSQRLYKSGFISSHGMRPKSQQLVTSEIVEQENYFEGEAGSSFIFNPSIVHKGTYPYEGRRTVIVVEVYPALRSLSLENLIKPFQKNEDSNFPAYPKWPWLNPYA